MQELHTNDSDKQIRRNIQQTYIYKLQEITRSLRQMEKEHFIKMKDLYGDDGDAILSQLENQDLSTDNVMIKLETSRSRSGEITKLVTQMNDLALLFKELSILVVQ